VIIRIVADVIDIALALARALRAAARAWRTWPGDAMGRLVMAACGGLRPTRLVRLPDGEDVLLGQDVLLVEDPRAARYLDHVPLRPYAQTLGRIVIARERLPDSIVRHELEHVRQWSLYGPAFLLVYGLESMRAMLAGGHRYHDNRFELRARAREAQHWAPSFVQPGEPASATASKAIAEGPE